MVQDISRSGEVMHLRRPFIVLIATFLFINSLNVRALEEADEQSAISKINSAETSLINAYEAILEAERAGANVAPLTQSLSLAGANLTAAYLKLKQRDYNEAATLAENCIEIAENVRTEASNLKSDLVAVEAFLPFWVVISAQFISLVGAITIITFFAWQTFKKRLYRKILGMKPETCDNEH